MTTTLKNKQNGESDIPDKKIISKI